MSSSEPDVFTAMVIEELNQYKRFYLYEERQLLNDGEYKKLANVSLRKTKIFAIVAILIIIVFSVISFYHFIEFGNNGGWANLILGFLNWGLVIASTVFYTRDIVEKRRTMERVLKLMEAKEEFDSNRS